MARREDGLNRVWTIDDSSHFRLPVSELVLGDGGKNPAPREFRLGRAFIESNRANLTQFNLAAEIVPGLSGLEVAFSSGQAIGALPLRSPSTGRFDFGLIVRPRFGWAGLGMLLSETGAKVVPQLPKLPAMPRSEHAVPRWVLATIILVRLEALLSDSRRTFIQKTDIVDRPRGQIVWNQYIQQLLATSRPNKIPCSYSDLEEDATLLGAVHATILAQLQSLQKIRRDAHLIARLLTRFERMRQRVDRYAPSWAALERLRSSLQSGVVLDALEAMNWSYENRGLAGLADFSGLPWRISMEQVFEARVESLARLLAQQHGGLVKTGRLRETLRPLRWNPPYLGSQRSLLPDVELLRGDHTIVFDAKYKSHWEELDESGWYGIDDRMRESHRADLLQILAYSTTTDTKNVTCVLVYPCRESTWESLVNRGRLWHRANIPAGERSISLVLVAIPFERGLEETSQRVWPALTVH